MNIPQFYRGRVGFLIMSIKVLYNAKVKGLKNGSGFWREKNNFNVAEVGREILWQHPALSSYFPTLIFFQ